MGAERAPAKLNLTLEVLALRDDGFHEIRSLMVPLALADTVQVKPAGSGTIATGGRTADGSGVMLRVDGQFARLVPPDDTNLAVRAALRLLEEAGQSPLALIIAIEKNIPVAAGLAGGSTDAAAALRAINRLLEYPFPPHRLEQIAGALGSDVPFCLHGQPAIATGRGERLEHVEPGPLIHLVLCKPAASLPTPAVYRRWDELQAQRQVSRPASSVAERLLGGVSAEAAAAWRAGNTRRLATLIHNDLAEPARDLCPEIAPVLDSLLEAGALAAEVSGSGPTCFGLFQDERAADRATGMLRSRFPEAFVVATRSVGPTA